MQSSPALSRTLAFAPALFVFLWSTGFIGARYGLPFAEPFTFLALRMGVVVAMLMVAAMLLRSAWPRAGSDYGHLVIVGLLVHGCYLGGVFSAVYHRVPLGLTALVTGLQPVLTAMLAGPLLGERIAPRQWAGVALGLCGVALVVAGKYGMELPDPTGFAWLLLALVGISTGTLYQKRHCTHIPMVAGGVVQYAATGLLFLLLAFALETRQVQWTGQFVFALAWLALVLSVGAIGLLYLMIRHGEASRVASLFFLTPPVTAVMALVLFDEPLGAMAIAGLAVAALGVALVVRAPRQAAPVATVE